MRLTVHFFSSLCLPFFLRFFRSTLSSSVILESRRGHNSPSRRWERNTTLPKRMQRHLTSRRPLITYLTDRHLCRSCKLLCNDHNTTAVVFISFALDKCRKRSESSRPRSDILFFADSIKDGNNAK